jgi:hypothetical protein
MILFQRVARISSNSETSSFFDEQGRTRVSAEAYIEYVAGGKPAENAAHRKKGHFRMETNPEPRYGPLKK